MILHTANYDALRAQMKLVSGNATSCCGGRELDATLGALDGAVMSAFVRAQKPLG